MDKIWVLPSEGLGSSRQLQCDSLFRAPQGAFKCKGGAAVGEAKSLEELEEVLKGSEDLSHWGGKGEFFQFKSFPSC